MYLEQYQLAKRLENRSEWEEAAKVWRSIGKFGEAETCEFIQSAIDKGDRFREATNLYY